MKDDDTLPVADHDTNNYEVILIKPVEHAGKHYQIGDILTVTDVEKQQLKAFGVI